MRQGRTLSRAHPGNQPLDFDEVTKCAEKQLNTVCGLLQRRGAQQAPLPGERVPLGPALGACCRLSLSTALCLVLAAPHTAE